MTVEVSLREQVVAVFLALGELCEWGKCLSRLLCPTEDRERE